MKRFIVILSAAALLSGVASAQENFHRGWALDLGAGASYTFGSDPDKWSDPLSYPTLAVGAIYNVTPGFSLRGELSGYHASAGIPAGKYSWYTGQLSTDALFNLRGANALQRIFNPYALVGVGFNRRTGNEDAQQMSAAFPADNQIWKRPVTAFAGRVGLGAAWRVSKTASIKLEVVDNVLSDAFNSYSGKDLWPGESKRLALDNHLTALVGMRFDLGVKKYERKLAEAAAAKAAAEAAAAAKAAAREKAAAEKAAADAAAAEEAARLAAEEAARKAAQEAYDALPDYDQAVAMAKADPDKHILFALGKTEIRESEAAKVQALAELLEADPATKVHIIGYADKDTGSHAKNLYISKYRAKAVAKALEEKGICTDRISIDFVGDEEQVEGSPEDNRLALCVVTYK